MRFSVIIPAYNAEDRIRKVLDSVKQQVFTDYECIVVCDSCEDRTAEIVEEYGFKAIRAEYHNDGLSRSRGIDEARGEFLLFLDDDDWWLHEYVLTLIDEKLRRYPQIDVLRFSFIFRGWKYARPDENWVAVWNKCWRRSFVGNVRFPNVYSVSDAHFHREVFAKKPKIGDWDMPMYYYNYLREGSISEQAKKGKRVE